MDPAKKWTVGGCGEVVYHTATAMLAPLKKEGQQRGRMCSWSRKRAGLLFDGGIGLNQLQGVCSMNASEVYTPD